MTNAELKNCIDVLGTIQNIEFDYWITTAEAPMSTTLTNTERNTLEKAYIILRGIYKTINGTDNKDYIRTDAD